MAPRTAKRTIAAVSVVAMLTSLPIAVAAASAGHRGGFCCWAADDLTDFCGTCLPMAIAGSTSYCSESQAACASCGSATWCEESTERHKKAAAGTELLLSFDGTQALTEDG